MSRRLAGRFHSGRPSVPGGRDAARQTGMVTVELAFASLVLVAAVVLISWLLTVVMLLGQCQAVASEAARQAARGDGGAVAAAVADRPSGASVQVRTVGDQIRVEVALDAHPWAPWLPSVPLRAEAAVLREPK